MADVGFLVFNTFFLTGNENDLNNNFGHTSD